MTIPFQAGQYHVRFAASATDVQACQALRYHCFFGGSGHDVDGFDAQALHVMVEDRHGRLVATMRLLHGAAGYAAQFYDLGQLAAQDKPMLEVGRFCIASDVLDADILRAVWGALTGYVDAGGIALLFGCASFAGNDPAVYGRALAGLARHIGPAALRPVPKTATLSLTAAGDQGRGPLPPLLRTYLAMGGWVGDGLVPDPVMGTMHIFTCVEVAKVPPGRARALRALAQGRVLT